GRRDQQRLASFVARPLWGRVVRRPDARLAALRMALLLLGAGFVVVALARPQWGIVREKVEREGKDVVLVLDTSGSMATADVAPSRFFLARQALLALIARLSGDRLALVAFEGEAYPLVPLTLDADALGLFLETVEPGIVPAPGSSLGTGLAKGLDSFVDKDRRNKALVLVSDGEDLAGDVQEAVARAKEAGVVVFTVGVGTEAGQPVPDVNADGKVSGYKRDESGNPVVSRLDMTTLDAIARGTGGQSFRITPADTSLAALAAALEGMEQKALAREFSYRRKERFQIPLAIGAGLLALGLLLPLPALRRRSTAPVAARAAAAVLALLLGAAPARAQSPPPAASTPPAAAPASPAAEAQRRGTLADELLLRPRRATEAGRADYAKGSHPQALQAFERAAAARPQDPAVRFNVADGLYKNGRYDEAATLFKSLGDDAQSGLAGASRYNLGNSLFQKQDYKGAVQAYRDALHAMPGDADTRRNLELSLRKLKEQEEQKKRDEERQKNDKDRKQDEKQDQKQQQDQDKKDQKGQQGQQKPSPNPQQGQNPKPQTPEEKADQRFREEAGMPKERAMQLLDALQQNEKAEQQKALALKRAQRKKGKDW
ncbi:MAG TPA: VWA domain-containing protein, partial [Planctomycetota bacterium]|nr:VWA domain-containing protein [Planctomycetota bacterium]